MIDLDWFEEDTAEAGRILEAASRVVSLAIGRPAVLRLAPTLDEVTRARVLALNAEVFGREGEVFDRRGLAEVEDDADAMFVVLEIDGAIEACCFGYYEDRREPVIPPADYVIDTALVSDRWRDRGVGWAMGLGVLLLVHLAGDVRRAGIAVWDHGDVTRLVEFYQRFGFVEAPRCALAQRCLTVELREQAPRWRSLLGLAPLDSG